MKYRNVVKINDSEYMCEVNHPKYGWIEYTVIPNSGDLAMNEIWEKVSKSKKVTDDVEINASRSRVDAILKAKRKVDEMTAKYTNDERALWDLKRAEAEKVVAGETSEIISIESSISEESEKDLAEKIIQKSDAYRIALVVTEATKKKIEKDYASIKDKKSLEEFRSKYTEG